MTHKYTVWLSNWLQSLAKPARLGSLLLVFGIVFRIRQYLANRSFWGDEASLAVNVVSRSFAGLAEPLGYHQAAPLGFLYVSKLAAIVFGNADYVLRLFPLICGVAALYLFYRIALEELGAFGLFALAMFAFNSWQTFYVSEFKQYGVDVTAALLLLWLSLRAIRPEIRRADFFWLGAAGAAVVWMSHASVFVLAGIGFALIFEKYARKKPIPFLWLLGIGGAWLVSFGVDYFVTLQYTAGDKFFRSYWMKSFLPLPPWSDIAWLLNVYGKFELIVLTASGTALDYWAFFAALAGGVFLFFKKPAAALLLTLPFFITLFASALQKYPLSHRFMLFLVPLALLLIAEALRGIYALLSRRNKPAALFLCALFAAVFLYFPVVNAVGAFRFPFTISEMKPILKYVAENRRAGDAVYIHYAAVPTFIYYAPFYQFDAEQAIKGVYRQDSKKAFDRFFEDVAALRGSDRVWIIFSEIPYCGGCEGDPIAYFKSRLDAYGVALDEVSSVASAAYLYDLNP